MDREPSEPGSYFALAGIHWLPGGWDGVKGRCKHHVNGYNPWHRALLKVFEDALRSVPGCERRDAAVLGHLDASPRRAAGGAVRELHPAGGSRRRHHAQPGLLSRLRPVGYTPEEIAANLTERGFAADTGTALRQSRWCTAVSDRLALDNPSGGGGYQQFSIQAHDGGHMSIGRLDVPTGDRRVTTRCSGSSTAISTACG